MIVTSSTIRTSWQASYVHIGFITIFRAVACKFTNKSCGDE